MFETHEELSREMNVLEWRELLEKSVVLIQYSNRLGEETKREITLIPQAINYRYKTVQSEEKQHETTDSFVAWDLNKNMWRRFKINNILRVERITRRSDPENAIV